MFVDTSARSMRTVKGKPRKLRKFALTTILALSAAGQPALAQSGNVSSMPVTAKYEGNASFTNYKFRNGETLPSLRIHYVTLGRPHKDAGGSVDNAILLLHWTGASSRALLSPQYQTALFASGAPLDISRFFIIIPDDIGHGASSKPS